MTKYRRSILITYFYVTITFKKLVIIIIHLLKIIYGYKSSADGLRIIDLPGPGYGQENKTNIPVKRPSEKNKTFKWQKTH